MKAIMILFFTLFSFLTIAQDLTEVQKQQLDVNYLINGGFENGKAGWSTYNDGASASPVDGVGGTANITLTTTTTLPHDGKVSGVLTKDAVNRQGQGIKRDFLIPDIAKGKVVRLKFSYEITSGTYASGDTAVWIYDVTNSRLIQPNAYTIENSGLKESKFVEFQSSIDSNSYRLIVHVTSTSASAYTLKFDSFGAGLGPKIYGSVVTDWQSFTPTGNWTTNTTYTGKWRRVGDVAEIDYRIALSGVPTAIGLNVSLPSGLVADLTKYPSSAVRNIGFGHAVDAGTMTYPVNVALSGATTLGVVAIGASGTYANEPANVNTTVPFTFGSGDSIAFTVSVKIAGWSSSQQLSSDADTRVVSFNAASVSPVVITNANAGVTKLVFTSVYDDSHGSYNASTGEYTVKVPGVYQVYAKTFITMASGMQNLAVYKNSGREAYGTTVYGATNVEPDVSWQGKVVAGDVISIRTFQTSGSGTATIGNGSSTGDIFFIAKLSGPSQIAASETISVIYDSTSAQTVTNNTTIVRIYGNKKQDTHNAYNASNGRFTAPTSGTYYVDAASAFAGVNTTWYSSMSVKRFNSAGVEQESRIGMTYNQTAAGSVIDIVPKVSTTFQMLQGDYLEFNLFQQSGSSRNTTTSGSGNYLSIFRVGNY